MKESFEQRTDLFGQFARAEWLFHRYHQQNHRARGPMGDPHRGQGRVLTLLKMQPEISQRELSYLLDMRPQSLGELLAKLEAAGYILRTHSEDDRRAVNISLTEAGRDAASKESDIGQAKPFDCLSPDEQETLRGYLARIIAAMEAELGDDKHERPPFDKGFGRGGQSRGGMPYHGTPPKDSPHHHGREDFRGHGGRGRGPMPPDMGGHHHHWDPDKKSGEKPEQV